MLYKIWAAVHRPGMRFVPIKSVEQQDVQCIHRVRSMAVSHRTAQANQIRGLLLEYWLVVAKGIASLRKAVPEAIEDTDNALTPIFKDPNGISFYWPYSQCRMRGENPLWTDCEGCG